MSSTETQAQPLPNLPPALKDAERSKSILHDLRHFHLGNPSLAQRFEQPGEDVLPALLDPYRNTARLRYDYPLFLFPAATAQASPHPDDLAQSFTQLARDAVHSFAPGAEAARILKDSLPWIERFLRDQVSHVEGPIPAHPQLEAAAAALQEQLKLDTENRERLKADLDRLRAAIPEGGQLLGYGHYPALHLLIHAIQSLVIPRHARFREALQRHIRDLRMLLDIDWEKSAQATQPEHLRESLGGSGDLFNPQALSQVMQHSHGSLAMSTERRTRIEKAIEVLENHRQSHILVRIVHAKSLEGSWLSDTRGFAAVLSDNPCATAKSLFDEEARELAQVFAAVRIADLEIAGRYDPAIHDPWFESFSWEAFSREELLLVPAVIILEAADRLAGEALKDFSSLLNSGRPVQVFVRVLAHANPGTAMNVDPFLHYRTELGYLGIAHRQTVISQSSAARHQHLLSGYLTSLEATRTSLHIVNIGLRPTGKQAGLNAWLVAGAALEGRVHPFFQINPAAGDAWAERMNFAGNPQPERDWPLHPFVYNAEDGNQVNTELAFTFADYALLIERLRPHFRLIPLECVSADLIPVADYLQRARDSNSKFVPYIWGVDSRGQLRQLAVTRALINACQDRLNFWHSLQEMAGVRNRYVEQAVALTRAAMETQAATATEQLRDHYETELERVRRETAAEVMGRLADALLGLDLSDLGGPPGIRHSARPAVQPMAAEAPVPPAITKVPAVAETASGFDEPWIDSPLCTSCNDCMKINPILFVYDENNQAYLSDPQTGTFSQLVEAAEICPSKCIHPGKPLNLDEPGLAELILRAAPFNA